LNDLASFQHDYSSLIVKIGIDIETLANSNFSNFWSYLVHDKSIVPAIQETLASLPTYLPVGLQVSSYHGVLSGGGVIDEKNAQKAYNNTDISKISPLIFDKTSTLLQYFQFISRQSGQYNPNVDDDKSDKSDKNDKNDPNDPKKQLSLLCEQTFRSKDILNSLDSIYHNLMTIFLRLSSPTQAFTDIQNLEQNIKSLPQNSQNSQKKTKNSTQFDLSKLSATNPFLSPYGPFGRNPRYTDKLNTSSTQSLNAVPVYNHYTTLLSLNLLTSETLLNFFSFFSRFETNIISLIFLRFLQYAPLKLNITISLELFLYYMYSTESIFVTQHLEPLIQRFSPSFIQESGLATPLDNDTYITLSNYLQQTQSLITILSAIIGMDFDIVGGLFNGLKSPVLSKCINSLPEQQIEDEPGLDNEDVDPDDPFADLIKQTNQSKGKKMNQKCTQKSLEEYSKGNFATHFFNFPVVLTFLIRLFDFTIPTIAQILHVDLCLTLEDLNATVMSTTPMAASTTTTTTTTTNLNQNNKSLNFGSKIWLKNTVICDINTQFENLIFRTNPIFSSLQFDILVLFLHIFNSTVLTPLGLQLTQEAINSHLYDVTEYKVTKMLDLNGNLVLGENSPLNLSNLNAISFATRLPQSFFQKILKNSEDKLAKQNQNVKDGVLVQNQRKKENLVKNNDNKDNSSERIDSLYEPTGFVFEAIDDKTNDEKVLKNGVSITQTFDYIDPITTNINIHIAMYNLIYTLFALTTPQVNPLESISVNHKFDKVCKQFQAQISQTLTTSTASPLSPNLIIPNASNSSQLDQTIDPVLQPTSLLYHPEIEFSVPGSLLYYLPLYGLLDLLKLTSKVCFYTASAGKKRPTLPTWVPTSSQAVVYYLDSILAHYSTLPVSAPSQTTPADTPPNLTELEYKQYHFDPVGFAKMTKVCGGISNFVDFLPFLIKRLNIYETTCESQSNEEYYKYALDIARKRAFGVKNEVVEVKIEEKQKVEHKNDKKLETFFSLDFDPNFIELSNSQEDLIPSELLIEPSFTHKPSTGTKLWSGMVGNKKTDGDSQKNLVKPGKVVLDMKLSEEEQFKQYLSQTGRTAEKKTKKGPKPTVLAPMKAEDKVNFLKRYSQFMGNLYDDEYDDSLDDYRGLYSGIDNIEDDTKNKNGVKGVGVGKDGKGGKDGDVLTVPTAVGQSGKGSQNDLNGGNFKGNSGKSDQNDQNDGKKVWKNNSDFRNDENNNNNNNNNNNDNNSKQNSFKSSYRAPMPGTDEDLGYNDNKGTHMITLGNNQVNKGARNHFHYGFGKKSDGSESNDKNANKNANKNSQNFTKNSDKNDIKNTTDTSQSGGKSTQQNVNNASKPFLPAGSQGNQQGKSNQGNKQGQNTQNSQKNSADQDEKPKKQKFVSKPISKDHHRGAKGNFLSSD
jgi:hypothetical protein